MATKRTLVGSLIIGLAVFGAGAASAAPGASGETKQCGGHGKRGPKTPEKLIERFDENQDGVLQLTELPERKRDRMAEADTNEDNTLSVGEIQAYFDARFAKKFAKKDSDGDGFITEGEVKEGKWKYIVKADTDGDEQISFEEFKAGKAAGVLGHGEKHGKKHGKR